MNEPMGRLGSLSPARERRMALATRSSAASWPTTRWRRRSSMVTSFLTSPSSIFETGIPVHLETMRATSSSSTSSLSMRLPPWLSICLRELGEFLLRLRNQAEANLCDALVVALAQLGLLFDLQLFDLFLEGANARDEIFFFLPVRFERVGFLANFGELFFNNPETLARVRVVFFLQRLLFDFELRGFALELIDVGRQRIDLDAQRCGGFVDQVDGLVGQEAVGDVAMRERGRGNDGRIFDAHAVMHFVFFFQAAKNRDGVFDVGLADEDDLEAAFERGVFLDVLAVFVERGGADGAQFSASERGLEHVGGIDRAFGCAGADERVQFVDEENDLALRVFDFFEDGFEAVFEFAAIFRAGEHRSEVERDDALVLQRFGHVAGNDALGEAFDDGGLADSGFADEHGIIFRAAGEHLDDAADFFIASDDRIELAAAGLLGQVAGIFLQRLKLRFGILVGDFLRAADNGQGFQDRIVGCAVTRENLLRRHRA